jgi:hypothetical protein
MQCMVLVLVPSMPPTTCLGSRRVCVSMSEFKDGCIEGSSATARKPVAVLHNTLNRLSTYPPPLQQVSPLQTANGSMYVGCL